MGHSLEFLFFLHFHPILTIRKLKEVLKLWNEAEDEWKETHSSSLGANDDVEFDFVDKILQLMIT